MNDVRVVLLNLELETKGAVVPTPEGDYVVFLNARYDDVQVRETYNHEITHLLEGHHYVDGIPVQELELAAADNTALLDKIKRVEECGLPLERVILLPESAPLADAEVRVTRALPPITWEEIEAERERQEEIRQDWVDRQRELQQAAYASFMQWW